MATYPVSRYLSIDRTDSPTLAVDGSLVFLADTTGTPQVWRLEEPRRWPDRLTGHEERVSFVAASPTRGEVVFGMDQGSNERDQLFRYDLETGAEVALTDQPEAVHLWGGWGPDGDRIAYAANRRQRDTFDVYVQSRDEAGHEADLVQEGPGGYRTVQAWHPAGNALVLSQANSSADQDLFWLDLSTGETERITDDEEAAYHHVAFGPHGDLYCITDHRSDLQYVARLDPETCEPTRVVDGGDWNVDKFDVDADTGRVAYTRNVDGYSDLQVGHLPADGDRLRATAVTDLPAGVVHEVTFGPAGERVAATVSADDHPYSVYEIPPGDERPTADAAAVERWTDPGTLGIPETAFRGSETIRYETFDGREIPAYWTLPEGPESDGTPVIVDIHGGPEHQRRPWFYPIKQFFLDEGYAIFEPNVRGSSGYGREYTHLDDVEKRLDSVRDIEQAVQWLRHHELVNEDRIVAYGRSYGGFMVLSAITEYPDLWAAAVDFVGIADFETFLENTGEWRRSHREQEYGSLAEDRDLFQEISPIHQVDQIQCPLFIQHGANDPRVPVGEAEQIAEAVEARGVPVETCIFEDEGHHTTSRENLIEEFERIAAFLDEHV